MSRNINFHQTFKPEKLYIGRILRELPSCNGKNLEEISAITGIPVGKSSGKVEPTISYAEYMGLLKKHKNAGEFYLSYTDLGKCVLKEDATLLEKLSLLLLHIMLVRKYSGADVWSYIFMDIFPKYDTVVPLKYISKEIELKFGDNVDLNPFKKSYQELFATLKLFSVEENELHLNKLRIDEDYVYLYAVALYKFWDEWLEYSTDDEVQTASSMEITASALKKTGFREAFLWNERDEYDVLELLASEGIIDLNRQMVPITIRRVVEYTFLLEKLYSRLC